MINRDLIEGPAHCTDLVTKSRTFSLPAQSVYEHFGQARDQQISWIID